MAKKWQKVAKNDKKCQNGKKKKKKQFYEEFLFLLF